MSLASSTDTSSTLALTYVPPPRKCPMDIQWIIRWHVSNLWNRKLAQANTLLCSPEIIFPLHTWRIICSQFRNIITAVASCIYDMFVISAVEVIPISRFISMDYMLLQLLLNPSLILWQFNSQRRSRLGKGCPVPQTQTKHKFSTDSNSTCYYMTMQICALVLELYMSEAIHIVWLPCLQFSCLS